MSVPSYLFVTGRLAEPSLRKMLATLGESGKFTFEVAVLPITVAALMTIDWIAKRLVVPAGIDRVIIPGLCQGELADLQSQLSVSCQRGPTDLRDLPEFFGSPNKRSADYGQYDIEIIAEINHAPRKSLTEILRIAKHYQRSGADIIDLGCDPGQCWHSIGDTVRELVSQGFRVSVDSFDPTEVTLALSAGASLVLSVNSSNRQNALDWHQEFANFEVVAIPDTPTDQASLDSTIAMLSEAGVRFRIDPILEPISFGFAASLGRYLEFRQRYPDWPMMMGIGNVTELTDVDSAGVNVVLAGFCQEIGIQSVLTTEVIPWCQSAVREFDLARRLVRFAQTNRLLPKRLEPGLIMLRDPKQFVHGEDTLTQLARQIRDRNYRLFAESDKLHIMNHQMHLQGSDPFELFDQVLQRDEKMDSSHAFYLGYELAKAVTALTLGKQYTQDQALDWGFLTRPEISHREPSATDMPRD